MLSPIKFAEILLVNSYVSEVTATLLVIMSHILKHFQEEELQYVCAVLRDPKDDSSKCGHKIKKPGDYEQYF